MSFFFFSVDWYITFFCSYVLTRNLTPRIMARFEPTVVDPRMFNLPSETTVVSAKQELEILKNPVKPTKAELDRLGINAYQAHASLNAYEKALETFLGANPYVINGRLTEMGIVTDPKTGEPKPYHGKDAIVVLQDDNNTLRIEDPWTGFVASIDVSKPASDEGMYEGIMSFDRKAINDNDELDSVYLGYAGKDISDRQVWQLHFENPLWAWLQIVV